MAMFQVQHVRFRAPANWKYAVVTKPIDGGEWRSQTALYDYDKALRYFHRVPPTKDAMLICRKGYNDPHHTVLAVK
jgi:hypothetical protein